MQQAPKGDCHMIVSRDMSKLKCGFSKPREHSKDQRIDAKELNKRQKDGIDMYLTRQIVKGFAGPHE